MPTVEQALTTYTRKYFPRLCAVLFLLSFIPLPEGLLSGNRGEPMLSLIPPIFLLISSGLVVMSYFLLSALIWPFRRRVGKSCRRVINVTFAKLIHNQELKSSGKEEPMVVRRSSLVSMIFIAALVSFFIPWQVAFIICYLLHFISCITDPKPFTPEQHDANNQKMHVLLMMSWCLPVVVPVLLVWVRTLATAGYTTPFDGDHFVGNVLGFMILTYVSTSTRRVLFARRPP